MIMSNIQRTRLGWGLWLSWVGANSVGFAIGDAATAWVLITFTSSAVLAGLAGAVFLGGVSGGLQGLVLRRQLSGAGWWVAASIGGWAVSWMVSVALIQSGVPEPVGWAALLAVVAVLGGGLQWLVLRRYLLQAGWWVAASVAGWALGLAVVFGVLAIAGARVSVAAPVAIALLIGALAGAVVGAVTGTMLLWLLRHPRL
jgi:hypothetical protein